MRCRKPKPTAVRLMDGNPGKRGYNADEPVPPEGCPECPDHLSNAARREWHLMAATLHDMGVLTTVDRAAFAACCQACGRWVEAEERLKETPLLLKTPASRSRVAALLPPQGIVVPKIDVIFNTAPARRDVAGHAVAPRITRSVDQRPPVVN